MYICTSISLSISLSLSLSLYIYIYIYTYNMGWESSFAALQATGTKCARHLRVSYYTRRIWSRCWFHTGFVHVSCLSQTKRGFIPHRDTGFMPGLISGFISGFIPDTRNTQHKQRPKARAWFCTLVSYPGFKRPVSFWFDTDFIPHHVKGWFHPLK